MKIDILGILSFLADVAPLIMFLIFNKLLKYKESIILFIWTIISVGLDFMIIFGNEADNQKVAFYNITIEPVIICFLYYTLALTKKLKIAIASTMVIFIAKSIYDYFQLDHTGFAYYMAAISVLIVLVFTLLIVMELLKSDNEIMIFDLPISFVYIGYIIYTAGNLFLFITTEKFPNIFQNSGTWAIFAIANIFKNSFLVLYIIKKIKDIKNPKPLVDENNIPYSPKEILKRYDDIKAKSKY